MFNLAVLDVAIGMMFVYLLLSLICTTATEQLSGLRSLRQRTLFRGILEMLGPNLAARFYQHPLVRALAKEGKKPSYIPARTFALAVMDIVAEERKERKDKEERALDAGKVLRGIEKLGEAKELREIKEFARLTGLQITSSSAMGLLRRLLGTGGTQEFVESLQKSAQLKQGNVQQALNLILGDIGEDEKVADRRKSMREAQQRLETWFDDSMERVSGWYRRSAQITTLVVAFAVTIAANADTLDIANKLWSNPAVRALVVEKAKTRAETLDLEYSNPEDAVPSEPIASAQQEKEVLTPEEKELLGQLMGWSVEWDKLWQDPWAVLRAHAVGWTLTALAVSLGAPFWFDTLNRFVKIRAAGGAPEAKKTEKKRKPTGKKRKKKEDEESEGEDEEES